jgi:glutamyl-tRNA synthetase
VSVWDAARLEDAVRQVAEAEGVKLGAIAQPLRAALTGRTVSPGIFKVMVVLGRDLTLGRLDVTAR